MNKSQLGDYPFNRTNLHSDNDTSQFLALVLLSFGKCRQLGRQRDRANCQLQLKI